MIAQIIWNQKCEDCAISTQKYHKSYRMWTCLIKVTFRHQKHIIKMCTKVTVTPCLYICTNLKIAKSYFSCQFMHRKDKFKQSAVPVQNRFVIYWRSYIHIVPYFLLFMMEEWVADCWAAFIELIHNTLT